MKTILLSIAIFCIFATGLQAQGTYTATKSKITFYSDAPLEDIEAVNEKSTSLLNTANGQMAFSVPINSFIFPNSLMQEHFNENYMESEKFPKATFSGTIKDVSKIDFSKNGKYNVTVSGDMTIHGEKRQISTQGTLEIANGKIIASAKFPIKLADYKIEIPTIVFQKIAEVVDVTVNFEYQPKK